MDRGAWPIRVRGVAKELDMLKDDAVKVLRPICQQIWKTQQWPQDWKKVSFMKIPRKGHAKETTTQLFKLPHNCTHFTR